MSKRNIIAIAVSFGLGVILFFPAMIFSALSVGDDSPSFSDFVPVYFVLILATVVAWLISKNWLLTVLVFGFFLLISLSLFGTRLGF